MTNGSLTKGQLGQKNSFENVNCKMVVGNFMSVSVG